MDINETLKISREIDGWLSDNEGKLLYNLAKNCKGEGKIVEIGSWKGKSTVWLASGSKNGKNVKVYAIDPHTGSSEHKDWFGEVWTFEEFKKNIKKANVDDLVMPIVKTSEDAAKEFNEPVELIFIDGAHEYEYVKMDFELWFPKIIDGGIIAFHDTVGWLGPKKVVSEYLAKSKNFKNLQFIDSITYAQKVKQNSFKDRIKNRYVIFLKEFCEFASKLHLPEPVRVFGKKIVKRMH